MSDITVERIYEDHSAYTVTRNSKVIGRVCGDEVATALREQAAWIAELEALLTTPEQEPTSE